MSAYKIKDGIHYVGALNPNLRIFDIIMKTEYGTSYNAYLVQGGEKTALIETVHDRFRDEYFENIAQITDVSKIDYIIFNHTEPDHSGSLVDLLKLNPNIKVLGTNAAIKNLKAITNMEFNSIIVKDGDTLDLGGGRVLKFIIAPNLHWPDSMFTYIESEKTLFPCDFLGCHYCETRIMDSKISYPEKYEEAFKYYFNVIFGPFKPFVAAGLNKIKDLDIEFICPSHGPVLHENISNAIALYTEWSKPKAKKDKKQVPVFYVSAYGQTKIMADALVEGIKSTGADSKAYDIIENDLFCLKELLEDSDGFMVGSPTINRDSLEPIWDLLAFTDAIINKGKPVFVFGSYGWSGEAVGLVIERLKGLKLNVVNDGYKVCFMPDENDVENLKTIATEFVAKLK